MTGAQRKSHTSKGTVEGKEYERGDIFRRVNSTFYRPHALVDVDTAEIREKLKNSGNDMNPGRWMNAIDQSVKGGIVDSSIKANVLDPAIFPDVAAAPKFGKPLFLFLAGIKAWAAYKGVDGLVHGAAGWEPLVTYATAITTENVTQGLIGGVLLKTMFEQDISLRDFKPSMIAPQIPFDRAIASGAQQMLSSPVLRYEE